MFIITHENPIQPIASPNMSPNIDGNEFPAGKYALKRGCCQCVTPVIKIEFQFIYKGTKNLEEETVHFYPYRA